ncbi:4Fe-4S dicluster domain-containing protein [Faecalicatena sp. AGMB00832]|uniref:4Fe-4S dicluster domain-containing protein n=1 Tax=Faecalicatena faecalis TaxID=2726362 RepID=A0ABS6D2F1_9FIRM|nr:MULTISPECIES: 4Fe-4S dicluster domain-containing protein [Faecalicatena]MBU3875767.1 4Fe-4S dicluster domain-containing protein [Faecalicatena faecalis]MCI6465137.1 4Fe-4S dicluster domain-containing protein [Faecalicatena sp.]MDY5621355.1 4Fe-4S dicluster domain-containing protein [Lachnospiraceae bacterium]
MMRGLQTPVRAIRRRVFTEVAKLGFKADAETLLADMEAIPYEIVNDDTEVQYRESTYRARAIVRERLRLAMGLSLRPENKPVHLTAGVEASNISEKYYEPPLMQVIPSACERCEENKYEVSNMCKGCLAHPCQEVCPKGAISMVNGKSYIDQEKCIKCGKCKSVCPYDAITKKERPCKNACGVGAIVSDKHGRAYIDTEKCVSCGMCMVSCPFGAISDKSQIFQLTRALKEGGEIVAEIAPAFVGQFGENITPRNIKAALQELGFSEVYEVALGADIGAISEAHHYVEKVVSGELPFLLTSCCPSWAMMAKKFFPDLIDQISEELTPMVATARTIKKEHPNARVVFIGPCAAKKLEASRRTVRSDVDFVVTYEELQAMFDAKEIDLTKYSAESSFHDATGAGRGYACAGGVAEAIEKCVNEYYPGVEVNIEHAEGLAECKKILTLAKAGRMNGCLIEGMGCPGGCIAGAGTNIPVAKAKKALTNYVKNSTKNIPPEELAEIELK